MQRVSALGDDLDVIDMSAVAGEQFERGIDLIVAAGRAFVTLDQHGASAGLDDEQRAHETRGGLFRRHEDKMQRPRDGRACGNADHRAIAHQCGIERNGNITARRELAEMAHDERIAADERIGKRADAQPVFELCSVGQFRDKGAVDKNQPPRFEIAGQRAGFLRQRLGRRIRRRRQRLGVAHQRAQIGIFPLLDPPMRQAGFGEQVECRLALRDNRLAARQIPPHLRKSLRQRGLGRRLDRGDVSAHAAASS